MNTRLLTKTEAMKRFKLTNPEVQELWEVAGQKGFSVILESSDRFIKGRGGKKHPKISKADVALLSMELFNKPERGLNY